MSILWLKFSKCVIWSICRVDGQIPFIHPFIHIQTNKKPYWKNISQICCYIAIPMTSSMTFSLLEYRSECVIYSMPIEYLRNYFDHHDSATKFHQIQFKSRVEISNQKSFLQNEENISICGCEKMAMMIWGIWC